MLQMRPNCECCNIDLPADSTEAWICSFECTFCTSCVESKLHDRCPNCGGSFSRRSIRAASLLLQYPASTERLHEPGGCSQAPSKILTA